jgi:hypothetical protein
MKIFIDFRRWFQILLVGVLFLSLVSFAPAVPPIQDETQGYWDLFDEDTAHNWIRDNYRGLKARYTPFFPSDYSIGATYEERNIQFKKDVEPGIFITEQATCSLSGYDLEKHKLLNPGDAIPLTLGVQASMVGPVLLRMCTKRLCDFEILMIIRPTRYSLRGIIPGKTTTADIVDDAPKTKSGKWLVPVGKKPARFGCWK